MPRRWGLITAVLMLASAAHAAEPTAVTRAMQFAPADTVGIIHVDVRSAIKELLGEVSLKKDVLPEDQAKAAARAVENLEALDVYMVAVTDAAKKPSVVPVLGLFGKASPDDIGAAMALLPDMPATKWTKAGNGRYTMDGKGPLLLVMGGEAPELAAGVAMLGVGTMLDKDFFAQLGKRRRDSLTKLLPAVDATADAWLAVDMSTDPAPDAPKWMAGSLFIGRKGVSKITVEFKDANWAGAFRKELELATKSVAIAVISSLSAVELQGSVVTIQAKSAEPLAGPIAAAIVEAKDKALRLASGRNLKAIGQAIAIYWQTKGKMPADLPALSPEYLAASALSSPVLASRFKFDDKPAKPAVDYVYTKLSRLPPEAQGAEVILAYEKLDTYDGEGTYVLLGNLLVRWVTEEEFQKLLKKTLDLPASKP